MELRYNLETDWIVRSLDQGEVVCAAFLGLRKAFDSLIIAFCCRESLILV